MGEHLGGVDESSGKEREGSWREEGGETGGVFHKSGLGHREDGRWYQWWSDERTSDTSGGVT